MNSITTDFDFYVVPWLGKTMKFIDYYITDGLREQGIDLTKTQMLMLHKLKMADGQPQHNLAFITNRDKASLARLLTTMENKNLVARIPCGTDGRVNLIYLTKQGEQMLDKAKPVLKKILDEIQQELSGKEIKTVISVMKKIQKNINMEEFVAVETNKK
ncbi:MAG: MarR family transcriptional regulator [Bacteroidetes bacterium]|nr:MarR family transcriptional regulator [Bacteroidota bacterium]